MANDRLKPPEGYESWVDYAVENMGTRDPFNDACFGEEFWGRIVERNKFQAAAQQELDELRVQAASKSDVAPQPAPIFPCTVVSDRYGGTYSGGPWTAWRLDPDEVPLEVGAGDRECAVFWGGYAGRVGKGRTPDEALRDLQSKCPNGEESDTRPATEPSPDPKRAAPPDIVKVEARLDFTLLVEFETAERKKFDMTKCLEKEPWQRVRNPRLFVQAHVEAGRVVWPGNIDIAPEVLHEGARPL